MTRRIVDIVIGIIGAGFVVLFAQGWCLRRRFKKMARDCREEGGRK